MGDLLKDIDHFKKQSINLFNMHVDYRMKDDCMIAIGKLNGEGYRMIRIPELKLNIYAHRFSFIWHKGKIEDGKVVMHKCDNRRCVNPNHLKIGTPKENTQDMIKKGRLFGGIIDSPKRKLTDDEILSIYSSSLGSYELSNIYNVSSTHIRRIRRGERCKSITAKVL